MRDSHSSPDPLNNGSHISPTKSQKTSRLKQATTPQTISKKRQTFQLDVGNEISPQKIRVTVEAADNGQDDLSNIIRSPRRKVARRKQLVTSNKLTSNEQTNSVARKEPNRLNRTGKGRQINYDGIELIKISTTKSKPTTSRKTDNSTKDAGCDKASESGIKNDVKGIHIREESLKPRSRRPRYASQTKLSSNNPLSINFTEVENITGEDTHSRAHLRSKSPLSHRNSLLENDTSLNTKSQNQIHLRPTNNSYNASRYEEINESDPFQNNLRVVRENPTNLSRNESKSASIYYPSPASPEKFTGQSLHNVLRQDAENYPEQSIEFDSGQEDKQDLMENFQTEEYRESDTILESEGFSIISVDSMPSMREHLQSPSRHRMDSKGKSGQELIDRKKSLTKIGKQTSNHVHHDRGDFIPATSSFSLEETTLDGKPSPKTNSISGLTKFDEPRDSFLVGPAAALDNIKPVTTQSSQKSISPSAYEQISDWKSPSPSFTAPTLRSPKEQLNLSIVHSHMPSSPSSLRYTGQIYNPNKEKSKNTKQNIQHDVDRNNDVTSRHYDESQAKSKQILSANTSKSPEDLREEEGEDFDLLLETLNSLTPVAPKYEALVQNEVYQQSKSPKSLETSLGNHIDTEQNLSSKILSRNASVKLSSADQQVKSIENVEISSPQNLPLSKSRPHPKVRKSYNTDSFNFLRASPEKYLLEKSKRPCWASRTGPNLRESPSNYISETSNANHLNRSEAYLFTPIPQKARFKPRPKVDTFPHENACSTSSYRSYRESFSMPPDHIDTHEEQAQSNSYIPSSPTRYVDLTSPRTINIDEETIDSRYYVHTGTKSIGPPPRCTTPQLQKLPQRLPLASPTKSCLRSPQKPTSKYHAALDSPTKAVTFESSSTSPCFQKNRSLSATTWTRDHWMVLDEIVKIFTLVNSNAATTNGLPGTVGFTSEQETTNSNKKASQREKEYFPNTVRATSQLLGKYIYSADGDRLKLEQWHLEAVDEFRNIAPGWEEKAVAMRLFALLVGERIRAQRKITKTV